MLCVFKCLRFQITPFVDLLRKSMPWYISTQENNYLRGGVNYEENTAKEK